jgi:hypothetical protein
VLGPDSKLQFDPDEQVRSVIRLIFDQFACLGSLSGLLRYLRQQHIELPYRVPSGPQRGQLLWHVTRHKVVPRNPDMKFCRGWDKHTLG